MNDKIAYLMKSEGLTSSQFAEILEIQPSGVSHLLSGRNKPRFDLLQRILTCFPRINPDWLLLDSDQIYRAAPEPPATVVEELPQIKVVEAVAPVINMDDDTLFSRPVVEELQPRIQELATTLNVNAQPKTAESTSSELNSIIEQSADRVVRVLLFYSDGTCESFKMR